MLIHVTKRKPFFPLMQKGKGKGERGKEKGERKMEKTPVPETYLVYAVKKIQHSG